MKLKNTLWVFMTLYVVACSDDNNPIEEVEEPTAASFQVIGEDANAVYQYDYDGATTSGEVFNLTEELGVLPSYLTLRQVDDFVSFYSFSQGAFSLAQKNLNTGATTNFQDFYVNGPERSLVWGTNTLSNVFFGYFSPSDDRILAIQDVTLADDSSQDLTIDFSVNLLFQPILFENKVYITYLDNQGNYKLTLYDTVTKTLGTIINFNDTPISILIEDSGDLAVIKNGVNATLEIYDADTLAFISASNLSFNTGFSPGPIEGAVLSDNKLFYALPFVQPALFAAGPAIFDLDTQENFVVDFVGIADQLEKETGLTITLTNQVFSSTQNMFFVGYAISDGLGGGGVMQISTAGTLVDNVILPFIPTDFIKD